MTVTALPPLAETTAADELEDALWLDAQGREVMHVVWRLACPQLRANPEALTAYWKDFRKWADIRDDLGPDSGGNWSAHFVLEELEGYGDAQGAAIDLATQRADEAKMAILFGTGLPL